MTTLTIQPGNLLKESKMTRLTYFYQIALHIQGGVGFLVSNKLPQQTTFLTLIVSGKEKRVLKNVDIFVYCYVGILCNKTR